MNINCPKCGFTQPQDQYCAKCGIDITTFKAPPQPMLKQLMSSLLVQLMLVFFIGGSAVFWVQQNSLKKTKARIEFLKGTSLQVQSAAGRNQFEQQQQSQVETPSEVTDLSSRGFLATSSEPEQKVKQEVTVFYLQVPEATLNLWLQEEVITRFESSDQLLMGYVQDLSKILANTQYQVKVLKSENFPLAAEQIYASQLSFPQKQQEGEIRNLASQMDVNAYATLDSISEDSIRGQLEVSLDQQNSFPIQFEMGKSSAVVLTGFSKLKGIEKSPDSELMVVFSLKK